MKRLNRFDMEWRSLSLLRRRLAGGPSKPTKKKTAVLPLPRKQSSVIGDKVEDDLFECLLSGKPLDVKHRAALSIVLEKVSASSASVRRHEEARQKAAAAVVSEAVAMDDQIAAREKVMNHFKSWMPVAEDELSQRLADVLDDLKLSLSNAKTLPNAHEEALIIEKLSPLVGRWHADLGEALLRLPAPVPSAVEVWADKHCRLGLPSIVFDTFREQLVVLRGESSHSNSKAATEGTEKPFDRFGPPVGGKLFNISDKLLHTISVCCNDRNNARKTQCGRVAVITGPAGSGKTITALMAARAASPAPHKALIFFALAKTLFGPTNADAALQIAPTIDAVVDLVVRGVAKAVGLDAGACLRQTDACLTLVIDEMDGYSQMLGHVAAARPDITTRLKALLGVCDVQIICTIKEVEASTARAVQSNALYRPFPIQPFLWPHLVKTMKSSPYRTYLTGCVTLSDDMTKVRNGVQNARTAVYVADLIVRLDYNNFFRGNEYDEILDDLVHSNRCDSSDI